MSYNFISTACQNLSRPIVPRVACICLGIFVVWQLVAGVISIFTFNKSSVNSSVAINVTPIKRASNVGLSMTFFGKYVPDNLNDADVKQSMLNLEVVGILLAAHEEDSQVILHLESGRDQAFRAGNALPGGAIIKRITKEGVFVERNGVLESLSFPKNELIFDVQPKPLPEDQVHAF